MQVLGDLIQLPDATSLPLPWWQRAPLGLLHGTTVHVGLLQSARPVGDIVASVLDINQCDNVIRVECVRKEESGVLADLMKEVYPLNIALAEAVTAEMGKEHHATLFCENRDAQGVDEDIKRIEKALKAKGFTDVHLATHMLSSQLPVVNTTTVKVEHGWLRNVPYRSWIQEQTQGLRMGARRIDLTRAVVSADTNHRLIRYVFPYLGARTVRIKHHDRRGALHEIFAAFGKFDLNVLSALLRRGGQRDGYAELIAVCEPLNDDAPRVYDKLRLLLEGRFEIHIEFSEGRRAEEVLYLPHPRQGRWWSLAEPFGRPTRPTLAEAAEPESFRLMLKQVAYTAVHVLGGTMIFGIIAAGALLPDLANGWLQRHIQDPKILGLFKGVEAVLLGADVVLFLRFLWKVWRDFWRL